MQGYCVVNFCVPREYAKSVKFKRNARTTLECVYISTAENETVLLLLIINRGTSKFYKSRLSLLSCAFLLLFRFAQQDLNFRFRPLQSLRKIQLFPMSDTRVLALFLKHYFTISFFLSNISSFQNERIIVSFRNKGRFGNHSTSCSLADDKGRKNKRRLRAVGRRPKSRSVSRCSTESCCCIAFATVAVVLYVDEQEGPGTEQSRYYFLMQKRFFTIGNICIQKKSFIQQLNEK